MGKTENSGSRGAGKVAFWAHKESIEKMLEAQHTLMATYLAHEKKINIGYGQFRRYVDKFIRSKPNGSEGEKTGQATGTSANPNHKETKPTRYKHDATKGSKRNDLV